VDAVVVYAVIRGAGGGPEDLAQAVVGEVAEVAAGGGGR
jgi:hypothetical protein